jgi:hypothetical protein
MACRPGAMERLRSKLLYNIRWAFIDFEKAFDNVNRNTLLDVLAVDNVPDQIIRVIYYITVTTKSQ